MSSERKLVAIQLANHQLVETMGKIEAEIAQLREKNEHLAGENARLLARLETVETQYKTLQDEYKKGTGQAYVGTMRTSKYGFGKSG
ncbi:MAG: hypothetical protein VX293_12940 [Candidatus Latescibacterota bacterium]|nr:hypothetical protein [Candidatus Latescibacterota bacterium]